MSGGPPLWIVRDDRSALYRVAFVIDGSASSPEPVVLAREHSPARPRGRAELFSLTEWVDIVGRGRILPEMDAKNLIAAWLETGGIDV